MLVHAGNTGQLTDWNTDNTLNTTQKSKQHKTQQNKTTLVQSPLMTLGQETRWAYYTMLAGPHRGHCLVTVALK